ncbi:integrase catalytic domain-containing protein [Trichonephila clavipes]|nr:integrase catalytic domain-containing protein [Trichonephila clavipes]
MDLRKWITNDANLMEQWKKENFNVHPVHETVSLEANGTKVLGLSWNTNEDYLTTDTKGLLKFVSLDKNRKRFILQAVGKIFDPLGLISPFTVRMKCPLQDLWKEEIQWDDPLPTHIEKEWEKWCEELPNLRNLKIPRLVLDSTLLEDDVELHSFYDASKKAYGAAIYLTTKSRNGISAKLVTSKSRVAPLNCITLPRLELLGALVAARLASKGNKTRWKQFVANRVNEITRITDPHSWYHCAGKENPADFLSRGLGADCLVSNSRWWTGAEFLSDSEFPKIFQQVVPELDYLTEHEKETVVQERKKMPEADRSDETVLLNSDSSSILDELLELSNNYFKVIKIRFNYNCRNKSKKVVPLTVAEFKESEFKLIKHAQRSLFDKKEIPSSISNLFPFVDGEAVGKNYSLFTQKTDLRQSSSFSSFDLRIYWAVVFCDSKAAIFAVNSNSPPASSSILDCKKLLQSLSEYSKQILLQWIPGHRGVTCNEFADHLEKKASVQQIIRKCVPFTSAKRIIKKKINNLSSNQYTERNSKRFGGIILNIFYVAKT